ncbi:MAG: GGDEF domain-containing protein [Betaproteobacteria bacterium]|nr:GGDEF domain-containing protein [Betaproteobacteria bacterium]
MVCSVLGPVSLAFSPGQAHMRPCRFWGAGLVALACGLVLISLRGYVPVIASQVLGLGLVGLALTFAQASARSSVDDARRDVTGWVLLGAFVLALVVLYAVPVEGWLRHLAGMGMTGFLACRVAYGFDQGKELREGLPLRMIGIIFGLFGVSLVMHGAFMLAHAESGADSEPDVADAVMLVGLIAGLLLGTILLLWVVTERIHFRMRQLVSLDRLTGALNRPAFVHYFEREIARTKRRSDSRFALLLINIDRLQRVNDAHGQAAGDRVLVTIVEILRGMIRNYDMIGRLEGDVFVLLMPGARDEGATGTADRIRQEIERQASPRAAVKNPVTVSIGVAVYGEHGESWDTMLHSADAAAKSAKANGRNRMVVAAPAEQSNTLSA